MIPESTGQHAHRGIERSSGGDTAIRTAFLHLFLGAGLSAAPSDPASLDRLHDIILVAPVSWWPPAPGWYVVGSLLALALLLLLLRFWQKRRANAYRRAALRELDEIVAAGAWPELPQLLKRTALAAFPRQEVASLSGRAWLVFLDQSGGLTEFGQESGRLLVQMTYAPLSMPDEAKARRLAALTRRWIREHSQLTPAHRSTPPC